MMGDRPHVFDLEPGELEGVLSGWGLAGYRAEQVLRWVYGRGVVDVGQMSDLSAGDRAVLGRELRFLSGQVRRRQLASDGVQKLLVGWEDDASSSVGGGLPVVGGGERQTECVLIPSAGKGGSRDRRTACVSSQVGCAVGCRFCASGLGGLEGNLSRGRIVEQVWRLGQLEGMGRVTNVVFMGMGEPLANLSNVVGAVRTITAGWGLGISSRRVTVSTVGLPAQIRRLADARLGVTLAVSLHAPNDGLRRRLIPWAQRVSIDQIVETGRYYFEKTGREVTLEYILLGGVNDRAGEARELVGVAKRLRSNVNLIRYNEVAGLPYRRPEAEAVRGFERALKAGGVNVHIRASRGRDIAAACGQLRREGVGCG